MRNYEGQNLNLDAAQLIKHSLGLIKSGKENKHLIYLYWTPVNPEDFEVYAKHEEELKIFEQRMQDQKDLIFSSMTYHQLWDQFLQVDGLENYGDRLKRKYEILIPF